MHVVGHQAPSPHLDAGGAAVLRQQIAVESIVVDEGSRAAIAALRDMVRNAGDDDTGEANHPARWPRREALIKCTVTVIFQRR